MGNRKSELEELVMLLIFLCVEQFEDFYSRVIGIQHFSTISKFVKQATPRLTYFSISYNNRLKTKILVSTRGKKIKEIVRGDDITKRFLFLCLFSTEFTKKW